MRWNFASLRFWRGSAAPASRSPNRNCRTDAVVSAGSARRWSSDVGSAPLGSSEERGSPEPTLGQQRERGTEHYCQFAFVECCKTGGR
eukprot:9500501-Pyramimonas_sp.AAC.1